MEKNQLPEKISRIDSVGQFLGFLNQIDAEFFLLQCLKTLVVEVGAEMTGGLATVCIKIGYSSRESRRVALPCFKIGYVSAMY